MVFLNALCKSMFYILNANPPCDTKTLTKPIYIYIYCKGDRRIPFTGKNSVSFKCLNFGFYLYKMTFFSLRLSIY